MALVFPVVHDFDGFDSSPPINLFGGELRAWGNNFDGQVGDGTVNTTNTPKLIGNDTDWEWVNAGQNSTSFAIKNDALYSWGNNGSGQLGQGNKTNLSSPTRVGNLDGWQRVYSAGFFTLAILDYRLYAWGNNSTYNLGLGDTTERLSPTEVSNATNWTDVAGGWSTLGASIAIRDGKLFSWGSNNSGSTGQGTTSGSTTSLTQIGSGNDWTQVSSEANAGGVSMFGIKNGELYGWGSNNVAQLGLGNTTNQSTPQQIGNFTNWDLVSAGSEHTMAIRDGKLYGWGRFSQGRLGNGSSGAGNQTTPTQIGSDTDWEWVDCGATWTVGIRGGKLYAWGNGGAWLGIGAGLTDQTTPVQVGSDTDWEMVSGATNHSLAIKG